jgi:hypothetical protein
MSQQNEPEISCSPPARFLLSVEEMILVAVGLSWHWDLKGSGLSPFRYRSLLAHILEPYHFFECLTDEPNVGLDPANILLVRIGKRVVDGDHMLSIKYGCTPSRLAKPECSLNPIIEEKFQ